MAISFVGSNAGLITASTTTFAFSAFANGSGSAPTLQQNDLVIVVCSRRNTANTGIAPSTTGYTQLTGANVYANATTDDTVMGVYYKFMGATPDTGVDVTSSGTTQTCSAAIHIFRGVDTTTPFDGVTPTTATLVNTTGAADPAAITPADAGAWIGVALACASANTAGSNTVFTVPTNIDNTTNAFRAVSGTRTGTGQGFYSGWTSGSFDPAAPGGGLTSTASGVGSAAALTYVLKPAGAGSQTLTPSLYTNSQTVYAATVSATYSLTPSLVSNGQTFYAETVSSASTLLPAFVTNSQTFYSATITGTYSLTPGFTTNSQTVYSATVTQTAPATNVTLFPTTIASTNQMFLPSAVNFYPSVTFILFSKGIPFVPFSQL